MYVYVKELMSIWQTEGEKNPYYLFQLLEPESNDCPSTERTRMIVSDFFKEQIL